MKKADDDDEQSGVPPRDSRLQVRGPSASSASPSIFPPSPYDSVSEREGVGTGAASTLRQVEHRRLDRAIACVRKQIAADDRAASVVVDVVALLGDALDELWLATEDPRAGELMVREVPLVDYLRTVYRLASETLLRLASRSTREELCMFWALAERVSMLPRIDARRWARQFDVTNALEPLSGLANDATLVNASIGALVHALRDLSASPKRESFAPEELEALLPTEASLRETILPPSRKAALERGRSGAAPRGPTITTESNGTDDDDSR